MPPSVEVTLLVTLFFVPGVAPVTVTLIVHELLGATLAVETVMTFEAMFIIPGAVASHTCDEAFGAVRPAGKLSVNPIAVSLTFTLGLIIVNVSVLVEPNGILVGAKAFVKVGGAATVKLTVLLGVPVPPLVELTGPVVFM